MIKETPCYQSINKNGKGYSAAQQPKRKEKKRKDAMNEALMLVVSIPRASLKEMPSLA